MPNRIKKHHYQKQILSWAEIDLSAMEQNLAAVNQMAARNTFHIPSRKGASSKAITTSPEILAVIKADAYGHGMRETARLLDKRGVGYFGVSDVDEGVMLRELGIKKPILLFESTLPALAESIVDYDLTPTVCTWEAALALSSYAQQRKKRVRIHIEVDTGMGRLGIWYQEALDFVIRLQTLNNIIVHGIYTHFPVADTDRKFTEEQITQLYALVRRLDQKGLVIPYIHAANSMGLAGYETQVLNLARPGLMIYGLYPSAELKDSVQLKPVLSAYSTIIYLKDIKKGRSISYGRTFIAKKDMKVATLPIGYYDGYSRMFSNKASVLVDGIRCPVLGVVTMDQIVIDVTDVPNIHLGMPVMVLGSSGDETVSADDLAEYAGTINYEIVCSLGTRLPRVYK